MPFRFLTLFLFFGSITFSASSQQIVKKYKRKGVQPVIVPVAKHKTNYVIAQLNGKWQEVSRTDKSNLPVTFNDTLFYYFSANNKVYSRDGVHMSLIGEAEINDGNVLTAAADVFTIRSLKNNQVILDDGEQIHTLIKKDKFWYESLPSDAVAPVTYTTPVEANEAMLIGNWKVYRRDAAPGSTAGKVLIRMLNVTQVKDEHNLNGEITFYQTNEFETLPCTILVADKKISITAGNNSWSMNVYKADGKEFIFGDTSLMYYCKPL